jgi:PTS system ascorbate-specific IIA component
MTGLFILAHAPLASALRETALHAFPEAALSLAVYDVPPAAAAEQALAEAAGRLDALGAAETLILTDVFGATPCNIARQLAERPGVRVLAGVNLPMVWRALNYRQKPLDELVALALAGATQGVMPVAVTRPQNQAQKPASHDPNDRHHQQ